MSTNDKVTVESIAKILERIIDPVNSTALIRAERELADAIKSLVEENVALKTERDEKAKELSILWACRPLRLAEMERLKAERDLAVKERDALKPRSVVAAVIRDSAGRYLIGKRRPEQWMGNRWCFVGGKVEAGETLQQAIIRECQEELGVSVNVWPMIHEQIEKYENGTWHLHYFDCELCHGETPKALDVAEFQFVEAKDLPSFDLLPVDIDIAKRIALQADNATLKSRLDECEEAVIENSVVAISDHGNSRPPTEWCVHCQKRRTLMEGNPKFEHATDCLVRRIEERHRASK